MPKHNEKNGGAKASPTKRQARYGKLVRGWDWRTIPERLQKAERLRLAQGITRTELLERAIDEYLAQLAAANASRSSTLRSPKKRGAWSTNGARDGIPLSGSLKGKSL